MSKTPKEEKESRRHRARSHTIMCQEEYGTGKKSYWPELEITGQSQMFLRCSNSYVYYNTIQDHILPLGLCMGVKRLSWRARFFVLFYSLNFNEDATSNSFYIPYCAVYHAHVTLVKWIQTVSTFCTVVYVTGLGIFTFNILFVAYISEKLNRIEVPQPGSPYTQFDCNTLLYF